MAIAGWGLMLGVPLLLLYGLWLPALVVFTVCMWVAVANHTDSRR